MIPFMERQSLMEQMLDGTGEAEKDITCSQACEAMRTLQGAAGGQHMLLRIIF